MFASNMSQPQGSQLRTNFMFLIVITTCIGVAVLILKYQYELSSIVCHISLNPLPKDYWDNFTIAESGQNAIAYEDNLKLLAGDAKARCNCPRILYPTIHSKTLIQSTCSSEATLLGTGQRVISFSLYKPSSRNRKAKYYKAGIYCNLRQMRTLYPGWVMRIYTDMDARELCEFACEVDVFVCNVRNIPVVGNLTNMEPMTWRFMVLGDPTVTMFAVRDADAQLTPREKAAVDQWILSGKPLHGMRDHPNHHPKMFGGMWGGDNSKMTYNFTRKLQSRLIKLSSNRKYWGYNRDTTVLQQTVYNKKLFLFHDSYHCKTHKDSVPFPTRRIGNGGTIRKGLFVGQSLFCSPENVSVKIPTTAKALPPCPVECRPSYGKKWKYC